ncbi:hypothetical protein ENSA5_01690 [Enhygromyxa salina]|uniref:Tetratricopeptide repeat protein n=1 Tax=Enhygromyxa salina TaxID=215803 RepID=A0A2S9YL74_9BACT|nr:hypothetical protein [Enhygromyxa salina]PRQ05849.1 hypothetical protein ENSA5_01690 [Enhygromyxa salina]
MAPTTIHAAPAEVEAPRQELSEAPAPESAPDAALIRAALEDGDLTTARELALARSEAEPSAANFQLEAEVWEALGDYANAKRAYGQALEALPEGADEREEIRAKIAELEAASRGTRADEPESSHRERLDRERADRLAALAPKLPPPPEVVDTPAPEPIVKKWYFWVTLGAIVASAGAIVGIAVASAVEDSQDTATGAARRPTPAGGVVFRF